MSSQSPSPLQELRWRAMNRLARREHARSELATKLQIFTDDKILLNQLLDELEQENLLSDSRYTESYIRVQQAKGYGPQRIIQALKALNIDEILIKNNINSEDAIWFELCHKAWQKRFNKQERQSDDYAVIAKQKRFLQYRGFTMEQINYLFKKNF